MNRNGFSSAFMLLCLLSLTSSVPVGENTRNLGSQIIQANPVSIFVKESDEANDKRLLPQRSFISRSNAYLGGSHGTLNDVESQRAPVHREIPERSAPTAYVHSSLGEFSHAPNTLSQETYETQERKQPHIFHNQDVIDNFNQNEETFDAPNAEKQNNHQSHFNNFNDNPQIYTNQQVYQHQAPNFGLKNEDIISQTNDYLTHESPSNEEGLPHINTNENLEFDNTRYIIDHEGTQTEEAEVHPTHISEPDNNFQHYFQNQFSGNSQDLNHIPTENVDEDLLHNNHNFQNSEKNQNNYVNVISQPYAGHIFNQNNELDHSTPNKRENIEESVHPNALFRQNSLQFSFNNQNEETQQPGKTFIQRLQPTLILNNVPPYKVESKDIPYSLIEQESENRGSLFRQTPTRHEANSHQSFTKETSQENSNQAPSVTAFENVLFPVEGNNHFDTHSTDNSDNSNIYSSNTEGHQNVNFIPSQLGHFAEQESQVVPQGRSLKHHEPSQFTHRTGFLPGKLEGGFVPSSFFSP